MTYCAEGLLVAHQVDYESCRCDEENLHQSVVQRDEVHEQVKVPDTEY